MAAPSADLRAGKAGEVRREAFELLNQGVSDYRRGAYTDAVEKLSASAARALNSFRAYYYLGLALIGDRRYADAVEALEVALDLDPNHLVSHVAMGDAYLKLGDLEEAQASYFRALKLRPEFPAALDGLARVYESRAQDAEAIAHFQRAIRSDKGFAPAYTHLGDLYLGRNRFEEAVQLLEEAITVRPDFAEGLNRLALAYGRLGLINEAIATIHKAAELEPNSALHPTTLGQLQLLEDFVAGAEASFRRSLAIDPGYSPARSGLAEVARRRGGYDEALEQVDLALADPRLDFASRRRLRADRERLEQEAAAFRALEQRIAAGEATPEDYAALASILGGRGDWRRAAELQARGPDTPEHRSRRAFMLFEAGEFRAAHEIYAALAAAEPTAELLVNDGVSLAMLGDDRAAVEAYRRALELDPTQPRARLFLGNALLRLGQDDAAAEAYLAYLERVRTGEDPERVRRILLQIAPEALGPVRSPLEPAPPAPENPATEAGRKGVEP